MCVEVGGRVWGCVLGGEEVVVLDGCREWCGVGCLQVWGCVMGGDEVCWSSLT